MNSAQHKMEAAFAQNAGTPRRAALPDGDIGHILIVDDTLINLALLADSLEGCGYRVATAQDGEEGLQRAEFVQPGLILLDAVLPGLDGFDVCRRLKANPRTRDIPVIFMTALSGNEDKMRAFAAGGVDYVTKPLQIDEVLVRVETHLRLAADAAAGRTAETAQRDSERHYREIFDNVSDLLYLLEVGTDLRFRFLEVNPAVEKLMGLPRAQIVGRHVEEVIPRAEAQGVLARLRRCVTGGAVVDEETELDLPTGRYAFHVTVMPVLDESRGRIFRIASIGRNITTRKQHEAMRQERAELESLLKRIVEVAPGAIGDYLLSPEGKVSMPNPSPKLEEIIGVKPDDAMRDASIVLRTIHPDDFARHVASIAESARTLGPWHSEFRMQHPLKGEIWIEGRSIPEREPDGGVRWYGFLHDVTKRKRAEEALRESEQRYREIFDNVTDSIFVFDVTEDGRFRFVSVNATSSKLTGVPEAATAGKFLEDVARPEQVARSLPDFHRCVQSGEVLRFEEEYPSPSGEKFTLFKSLIPVRGAGGAICRLIVVTNDITALKKAERRIEDSHAQLRELIAQRETAREEERKHIARELHDELGQILTALRMHVSLLRVQFGKDNQALMSHLGYMTELVDQNIQVVRDVASALRPAVLDMGVPAALEWLTDEFARNAGIPCDLDLVEDEIALNEESGIAVFRMVQESLTNVVRHADATKASVSLQRKKNCYRLEVRDDGKGFDPDQVRKKSLGLVGLRERALMLGGEVCIASAPGQGTSIVVRIPLENVEDQE